MADGNYITQAQVIGLFGSERQLASLTNDTATGIVDTTDIDDMIEFAEGEIDVRLAVRYETPVNTTENSINNFLRRIAGELCFYKAMSRKPPVDPTTQLKYDQAIATLTLFVSGELMLPGATTPTSTTSREPLLQHTSNPDNDNTSRLFTRTKTARL